MLLYAENITPRLEYISRFILSDLLGYAINYTTNENDFQSFNGLKICYCNKNIGGIYIKPVGLLSEDSINEQEVNFKEEKGIKVLFPCSDSDLGFDLFSASFYLITRYEEYLPYETDKHGRYKSEHSIAHKHSFLDQPIINIWANILNEELIKIGTPPRIEKKFQSIITFDIDHAYAFNGKGTKRYLGGLFKELSRGKLKTLVTRIKSTLNKEKDPNNTFDYLLESTAGKQRVFFFLNGDHSTLDKNLLFENELQQQTILKCAEQSAIGIHPSYKSNSNGKMDFEKSQIEGLIKKSITKSRQHYLYLKFPKTYNNLIRNGIEEDYSMGYESNFGFRASTCTPFKWYDLSKNEVTDLTVYPIGFMDVTAKNYLKLTATEAKDELEKQLAIYKEHNGTFVLLWHNSSFNELEGWKGWKDIYEMAIN